MERGKNPSAKPFFPSLPPTTNTLPPLFRSSSTSSSTSSRSSSRFGSYKEQQSYLDSFEASLSPDNPFNQRDEKQKTFSIYFQDEHYYTDTEIKEYYDDIDENPENDENNEIDFQKKEKNIFRRVSKPPSLCFSDGLSNILSYTSRVPPPLSKLAAIIIDVKLHDVPRLKTLSEIDLGILSQNENEKWLEEISSEVFRFAFPSSSSNRTINLRSDNHFRHIYNSIISLLD